MAEIFEDDGFEEIFPEEGTTTTTVNIANKSWNYNTTEGYLDITATSDYIGWWLNDYGGYDTAKAWIVINASDYNSVTLKYSNKNHTQDNSEIAFGVFDNDYPDDDSGQTQLITSASGSITFDLSGVTGTKYVGFYMWGNSYMYDSSWGTYSAGGDMQIISITAEKIDDEEIFEDEDVKIVSLSYNANGGSGAPASSEYFTESHVPISNTIPTRTGYVFLGWSTSSSATSASYVAGDTIYLISNVTLYAVWKTNTYTVTYNANGGSGAPSGQTVTGGTNLTISSTIPTRFPYTFWGWSTDSSAIYPDYAPGDSLTISGNTTLYAVWQSPGVLPSRIYDNTSTGDISFGGREIYYTFTPYMDDSYRLQSSGSLDTKIYIYNASGTLLASNDDGGENRNFLLDYSFTPGITYYIKVRLYGNSATGSFSWTMTRLYTVTYDANGGSGAPSSKTEMCIHWLSLSSIIPARQGYTFLGWSADINATSATYQPGDVYTDHTTVTLYAVWKHDGLVYICDSTGEFCPYEIWIYDGSGWNQYEPYICNGSSWDLYS